MLARAHMFLFGLWTTSNDSMDVIGMREATAIQCSCGGGARANEDGNGRCIGQPHSKPRENQMGNETKEGGKDI